MCGKKSNGGLGFRNLRDFNIALLGKQGWRLIVNPDSLVGKIYKQRYYPNDFFLTAKMDGNPSYIWRSIMEAQVLLKQGAVRRVGKGTTVSIINDPWLLDKDPYIHTRHEAIQQSKVNELMDLELNSWDTDLVHDIFEERDAKLILSVPLNIVEDDMWYWKHDKLGKYTVKSAYAAIQESKRTSGMDDAFQWNILWNLRIPLKVKHFLWRAVKNVLPTKDQLINKRVPVLSMCPICNLENETVYHILVSCPFAKLCWNSSDSQLNVNDQACFRSWMANVLEHRNRSEAQTVAMICWSLWKNRNEIVWNQNGMEYSEVLTSAKLSLNQWMNAQDKSFDHSLSFMTQEDGRERWEEPKQGTVKVNVDAAIFDTSSSYSISMVVRDHVGDLMLAAARCKEGQISPELAEAVGIKEALSWIKDNVMQPAVVETDCLTAVQAIRCSSVNLSYLGRVIDECKTLLKELKNRHVTLNFVKRCANKVAHFLARHNSSIADRFWYGYDTYPELHRVMSYDLKV